MSVTAREMERTVLKRRVKPIREVNEDVVNRLKFLVVSYDESVQHSVKTQNRLHSLGEDLLLQYDEKLKSLMSYKNKLARDIEKELEFFPIWRQWLINVPGIGPALAGRLILLYYYKHVPICPKCGGEVQKKKIMKEEKEIIGYVCTKCKAVLKGQGNLKFKMMKKDFPMISSWWSYMGRSVVDGKMPKRKKGEKKETGNWSSTGRTLGFNIGDSFIKQGSGHKYREIYDQEKRALEINRPEITKLHRHNMAKNKMIKLFLAHFWQVARTIDKKTLTEPYSKVLLGHTNIIEPFYWR